MSGGAGTRLWPLSTAAEPKQFHVLFRDRSLFQETASRLRGVAGDVSFSAPVVVSSAAQAARAAAELGALGIEPAALVAEPRPRGTAAAAAVAADLARSIDPEALVLFAPSDHVMNDPASFHAALAVAAPLARENIVTFGITPWEPATGSGYIRRGKALAEGVFRVEQFAEKPDAERAQEYVASGAFLWNAGIFLFAPELLLSELGRYRPDILAASRAALADGTRSGTLVCLEATAFEECPTESIDYAVMERTTQAAVATCDPGWADVGSWNALWRLSEKDELDNAVQGRATVLDGRGNLVWARERPVVVLGVDDLVVVETAEAVIVLPRRRSEEVKRMLEAAAAPERER